MSEPSCSSQIELHSKREQCQVCGQKGHGNHFGAVTCRACAAFFRRSTSSKLTKKCKSRGKCVFLKDKYLVSCRVIFSVMSCKKCRLQKCFDVGMTQDNFQFNRDPSFGGARSKCNPLKNVAPTLNTFLGRPNLIIYVAPGEDDCAKNFVDVKFLLENATNTLLQGAETPFHTRNRLRKLANGHKFLQGLKRKRVKIIKKVEREDIFYAWEEDMKKAAKWLTYFDEFQKLDHELQVIMLKSTWRVWTRLDRLAMIAIGRRQKIYNKDSMIMWNTEDKQMICFMNDVDVGMSWCTKYTMKQLKLFEHPNVEERMENLIDMFLNLDPTDEEMSYMLAQLCFHYVAKRHGGEIAKVAEHLQESIANDLHDYYVNELNMPNYSGRIAKMMKVNNHIQEDIYQARSRSVVAKVFELFNVEFSHPEMFIDF